VQVPLAPHAVVKDATVRLVGPVNVVLAELAKSTWNFQNTSWVLEVPRAICRFGSPAGGAVPSTSAGSRPPKLLEVWKHCWVAVWPASIAVRSSAQLSAPRKVLPLNRL